MATATQKITLASARDIPFHKLVLSQANVRRVKAGVSVDELAESIARRGLIQSLHVRPVLDADGKETGTYEVPAGGRRFRALELLVKQKRLARTTPVPCIVSEAGGDILIDEVSLAENIERAPLHPLDQFRAFHALREKGMTEEAIAAAFFVGVSVVKQRLRLASVSPILLDVYADDGMTLEQLMAFTISEDHARQKQVWSTIGSGWNKEPYQIRRMLTETTVHASDRRALFVGIAAYEAAGGLVLRDLFQSDDGGWLQDAGLLDRLVSEKLKAAADAIAEEGWKWVEAAVSFPYGASFGLRALDGTPIAMTEAEIAQRDTLQAEFDRLNEAYDSADELPDEVDARLGEIEAALDAIDTRPMRYDPRRGRHRRRLRQRRLGAAVQRGRGRGSVGGGAGRHLRPVRRAFSRARGHQHRRPAGGGRDRRGGGRRHPATAGAADHRADRASDAGAARRRRRQSAGGDDRVPAQARLRRLRPALARGLPRGGGPRGLYAHPGR